MINFLEPFRQRRKKYEENPALVEEILKNGSLKAKKIAEEKMKLVRKNMQLNYFE